MMTSRLIHGDCLEVMADIPDGSIDAIIADLPFQVTQCHWDILIPFEPLWTHYKRVIKPNGAIVLFGSQPFTTDLINSNRKWFKYEWIWSKNTSGGFAVSKSTPMRFHENILVFCEGKTTYNPIMREYEETTKDRFKNNGMSSRGGDKKRNNVSKVMKVEHFIDLERGSFPKSIISFKSVPNCNGIRIHPTQKPIELLEYLTRTYTNEGETVLDNTAGVMTTAIACLNTNRQYICIEKDDKYFALGSQRVEAHIAKMKETAVQLPFSN